MDAIREEEYTDWTTNAAFYVGDDESPLMQELAMRRDRYFDLRPGDRVLDLGCGSGAVVARLRKCGVDVVGVDYAEAMVDVARETYGLGDKVRRMDATDLQFESNSFDVVLANGVLHHLTVQEQLDGALSEVHRILRPGGRLCCFDRNGSFASAALTHLCVNVKEALRVLTRRERFASCASRNEISFGAPRDLKRIERAGFSLHERMDVSTVPFFLSVVTMNATQYFLSERLRRFAEAKLQRSMSWIDGCLNWRWLSIEQFVIFHRCASVAVMMMPAPEQSTTPNQVSPAAV